MMLDSVQHTATHLHSNPAQFGNRTSRAGHQLSLVVACSRGAAAGDTLAPGAPMMAYLAIAFSNMMATTCQYEALRYVSFPTQTLAKTAKMIPVMIWGTLLSRRTYKLKDYVVAGGVTLGTTCFLLTGEVTAKQAKAGNRETSLWGLVIMIAYLFFDGFTSTVQERLFKNREVSTWNQMLYVGLLSGVLTYSPPSPPLCVPCNLLCCALPPARACPGRHRPEA
jgi:adenosine 3'-phospho 5'-phosphosulfate transporter B2